MNTLILILSTFLSTTIGAPEIYVGDKHSGDPVSYDYLEQNSTLSVNNSSYKIESFHISMEFPGTIYDKVIIGNSFKPVLADIKKVKSGKKIYFDVKLVHTNGVHVNSAASFSME